jgi:hypothetical protein
MAHYARLNSNNIVEQVIVISDDRDTTEAEGMAYCQQLTGHNLWRKTSYNNNIRKNYAGIGYSYDYVRDAFIPPKPYPSWLFDESTCRWQAPVEMPQLDGPYIWDEITVNWRTVA